MNKADAASDVGSATRAAKAEELPAAPRPRTSSNARNLSNARETRFWAVSSLTPRLVPMKRKSRRSRYRKTSACRSDSVKARRLSSSAASISEMGVGAEFSGEMCIEAAAVVSLFRRRSSVRMAFPATKQVCRCSQPPRSSPSGKVRA